MGDKKQTAVEWLFNKLLETPKDKFEWYSILCEAKEMEKEQMIGFSRKHYVIGEHTEKFIKEEFDKYYNETYERHN